MPETNDQIRILAINPGWRYLGTAVFCESELREWRLKIVSARGFERKMEKVKGCLAALIERYHPNILAIKKLHPSRSSANLRAMTVQITSYCRKQKMAVYSYSIVELETLFSPTEKINKRQLAAVVASEYPALCHEFKHEQRNRNPYYARLFEAVALGHVCLNEVNNKH